MNVDAFCRAFCERLSFNDVPIGGALKTPFVRPDGDAVSLYVRRNERDPGLFRLEDDGTLMAELEIDGFDLEIQTRIDAFGAMLQQHNVLFDEAEYVFHTEFVEEREIPRLAWNFCHLLLRVPELSLLITERTSESDG